MSTLDVLVIVVYLIMIMCLGLFVGKDNKTQEDYFLAGRSMPWIPIALSVAATMISANSFVGGPGWAYTDGIMPFMQNVTVPLACFIAATITAPIFYYLRVSSVYEYMGMRLGKWSRFLTVIQFFINSLIQVSSMVYVPALIIRMITGWDMKIIVPIIVGCAIVYTITGGIKAVIWTDAVQMIVLWGGMIAILFLAVKETGMGFVGAISQAADTGKYNAFDFSMDISRTNSLFCSCFGVFMWIRYFCFDQAQVQRILTSKSMRGIKKSLVTSTIMMNLMYFLMLFVGTIFFVVYQGKKFETSNEIMIGFMLQYLPKGVLGLVIAAVFAAAMSSVDSLLNSMTTTFTKDIYEQYFSKDKGRETTLKRTIAVSTVLGVIIIFIVIIGFDGSVKSVIDVVGRYISYFAGPALGAFLLAMFTTRASDKGVAIGFVSGLICGYLLAQKYEISWLLNPAIGAGITMVCGYLISMVIPDKKTREETLAYTAMGIRKKMLEEGGEREDGVYAIPFKLDKYAVTLLIIFVLQYVILVIIR